MLPNTTFVVLDLRRPVTYVVIILFVQFSSSFLIT